MRIICYALVLVFAAAAKPAAPAVPAAHGYVYAGVCDGATWSASNFEGLPACKDGPASATIRALRGLKVHAALPADGKYAAEIARVRTNQRIKLVALHRRGPKVVWAEVANATATDFGQFEPTP